MPATGIHQTTQPYMLCDATQNELQKFQNYSKKLHAASAVILQVVYVAGRSCLAKSLLCNEEYGCVGSEYIYWWIRSIDPVSPPWTDGSDGLMDEGRSVAVTRRRRCRSWPCRAWTTSPARPRTCTPSPRRRAATSPSRRCAPWL